MTNFWDRVRAMEIRGMRGRAIVFAVLFAIPSAAEAASAKICLRQDAVQGWKLLGDDVLIVTDHAGKKFRLAMTGACHDLQFQTALTFSGAGGESSCLAPNDRVAASFPGDHGPPPRCVIAEIREYTAAMENADEMAEGTQFHHPDTHGEIGAIP
jgi:hypothetical protein